MRRIDTCIWKKIDNWNLSEEEKVVVHYGLTQALKSSIGLVLAVIIAVCMDVLIQAVAYIILFLILRINMGGYHAKSERSCAVTSLCMIYWTYYFFTYNTISIKQMLITILVSLTMIWGLAPIDNSNRRFSIRERNFLKKRVRRILVILLILTIIFTGIQRIRFLEVILAVNVNALLLLVMGLINNKRENSVVDD